MSFAEARAHVAAALANLGVPVHEHPPTVVVPPAVVLTYGSPYWESIALGTSLVGLDVKVVTSTAAGQSAYPTLDALLDAAVTALAAIGVGVGAVTEPNYEPDAGVLTATIPTLTTWED